jgi:hypothetical protein
MDYRELIVRALNGRSVNGAAKAWGVPQKTLENYVKGKTLPNYSTAGILAREAGIGLAEVMTILMDEEHRRKPMKDMVTAGFRWLTNALNRLYAGLSAV